MIKAGTETDVTREELTRFLTYLVNRHEVSATYIESLVPTVEAIFKGVAAEVRGGLLLMVEENVIRQSMSEALMGQASAVLENLRQVNKTLAPVRPTRRSRRSEVIRSKTYFPSLREQFHRKAVV